MMPNGLTFMKLSIFDLDWLHKWCRGSLGCGTVTYRDLLEKLPERFVPFAPYRPLDEVTLYRAVKAGETHPVQSWTYSKAYAQQLVDNDSTGRFRVVSGLAQPWQILVDFTRLPAEAQPWIIPEQQEVIVCVDVWRQQMMAERGES